MTTITATTAGVHRAKTEQFALASRGAGTPGSAGASVSVEEGMATVTTAPAAEPRIVVGGSQRGDSSRPSVPTVAHKESGVATATTDRSSATSSSQVVNLGPVPAASARATVWAR
ncbi:hypothetical protein, partial [Mycobacterium attenuatum]|uniref:hypothetical protein n=1 Tax=Mycobacterium attenuatum TaxID=2341086 RepID=UPI002452D928